MIDGGRNDVFLNSLDAEHGFHSTGGTEQVAGHRLGGRDVELVGVVAEYVNDGFHLRHVADGGRGAVHVDVVDVLRLHAGILESVLHREDGAETFGVGGGEVVSVGAHAAAGHFGVNLSSAGKCVLEFFKDEHGRAFAHHESVAALREGARCGFGRVVAG